MGIVEICKTIQDTIDKFSRAAFPTISSLIMLCSLIKRPGLSCIVSTSNIINAVSSYGMKTDDLPSGEKNNMNFFIKSVVCEVFRAIKEDSRVQGTNVPGSSVIMCNGGNAGGPISVVGTMITGGQTVTQIN